MALRYDAGEIITAMVTPFDVDLNIDYPALEKLIEHLISTGSDAILVAGTTGESPTLTHEEELQILAFVKEKVNGRVKIVMGAGSNCTKTAVEMSKKAEAAGADAILSVVPYYNKPSQSGMYEHFSAVANSVKIPIILYNIPGRTGVNMAPSTIAKLAKEFKNIVAVKQSNSDLDLVSDIKILCPDDFAIYSGDDSLTLPMISLGAHGVISVASHVAGKGIREMIKAIKSGDVKTATEKHLFLYPAFKKIFMLPNPIPIKEVLSKLNIVQKYVRLPLVTMTKDERNELYGVLNRYL